LEFFVATPKLGFGQKNESGEQDKQHPLPSQNQEASKEELKTDGCATHGTNGSKLTASHYFLE